MNYFVTSLREVNLNRLLGHLKTPVTQHDGEEFMMDIWVFQVVQALVSSLIALTRDVNSGAMA